MQDYRLVTTIEEIEKYFGNATVIAFDFECSPNEKYKEEKMSALDAHKSEITGVSFSVAKNSAIYVPFHHKLGKNAEFDLPIIAEGEKGYRFGELEEL